ncbi:hypothetical protein AbraIFM66951_011667 [Aspergillus brasiliensis]|uniref:Bacterial collagen-like protein middle domain-containing protein n=1 Tax=Aspergillus brasiliensis TaxID=319629 RepID=A0A9W6DMW6_9EURO|nr:hypothetical protein AbraCBS73388_006944 [Aspergillus brasiliensis]GKZ41921.1 hypothetical protein AbraIFM66951_011667 [Aspergillus brasiliensis]
MKASFITLFAALATSAIAAPTGGVPGVSEVTKTVNIGSVSSNVVSTPSASASTGATGHIVQDVGNGVNQVLTVTGSDAKKLLIQLSPDVANLLSGLGLPGLGSSVGSIIKTAASVGDLIQDIGNDVDGLLTVVSKDGSALLIQLDPVVAGLISGLGLPGVGVPVGSIIGTLGENFKRSADGKIVQDLAPKVKDVLEVTGSDSKRLLVQLSPSVASLLSNLNLPSVGTPVGQIVNTASNVGDLLKDVSTPVEQLLTVVGQDGSYILIQLSPEVASLLSGLSLPTLGTSVGSVVATLGQNL